VQLKIGTTIFFTSSNRSFGYAEKVLVTSYLMV